MAANSRFPFTKKRLAGLPVPAEDRAVYHDASTPGLILRITPNGQRSFSYYRKVAGRPVRLLLGTFPGMTVEQARKACNRLTGAVAEGRDPAAERRSRREEPTLKDLFGHWLETHAKARKKTWPDDVRMFNKYLGEWHNRKLSAIRVPDVVAWHRSIGRNNGPIQANRCKALLATMFAKAFEVGYAGSNPCTPVANFAEQSRERFLLPDEMRGFFTAVAAEEPVWRDFFLLCLFVGARRGNVASMRWEEIDLAGAVWHVPASKTKNKRPAAIVLCPPAVAILQARREQGNGSEWVFPSGRTDDHVIDPRKAWTRVLKASGIKNLRMHDLRRSLGSWQAAAGVSLPIIGKALGHADLKSTQVYSRLQLDPVRQAVSGAVVSMLEAGGVKLLGDEKREG